MHNIESLYTDYEELLKEFGEDRIKSRYEQIYDEMQNFLKEVGMQDKAKIQEMVLMHAVLDYFSDIQRLKEYQQVHHVNDYKIKAYETHWLLQRKVIQLVEELEDDKMLYINERFLQARLAVFMLGEDANKSLIFEKTKAMKGFLDTLYYYLKFRNCDPQSLELVLLAFHAGRLLNDNE